MYAAELIVTKKYSSASMFLDKCIDFHRTRENLDEIGLPLAWSAIALQGLGRLEEAAAQLHKALSIAENTGCIFPVLHGLPAAALLLVDLGQEERAVAVYETALQFAHVANARLFEDVVGVEIKAAAAELPPEVVAEAKNRGKAADPWAVTAELADVFAKQVSADSG
jgi:tetratricopeptide (TPR) repeat protein